MLVVEISRGMAQSVNDTGRQGLQHGSVYALLSINVFLHADVHRHFAKEQSTSEFAGVRFVACYSGLASMSGCLERMY